MENVIILGTGIAGLTAAIYTARANLNPLVIEGPQDGGQLTLTTDVENFPGFPEGVQGPDLVAQSRKQAERFGAKYKTGWITEVTHDGSTFTLKMEGAEFQSKALIVATGASARWLGCTGEEQYKGRGVTTCATCDGFFYKDKEVIVVGGGDSAMEEALFLTRFCTKVTIIHRRDKFRASHIMAERAKAHEKIDIIWNAQVSEVLGDGKKVTGVKLTDTTNNEEREFKTDGIFLAIGHTPNTKFLRGLADLDDKGYLKTDRFMKTNVTGLFGAGDVQDTVYRQAITAAGSGCQAAIETERFLAEHE